MKNGNLNNVTGKWVRDCYEELWRTQKDGGCCSVCFESDDKYRYCVCIGWIGGFGTQAHPEWKVGWKIGRQTHDNIMQCDMDIDFETPYDPETGDVDDTEEAIETIVKQASHLMPVGYKNWNALAAFMRKTARRVLKQWKERK